MTTESHKRFVALAVQMGRFLAQAKFDCDIQREAAVDCLRQLCENAAIAQPAGVPDEIPPAAVLGAMLDAAMSAFDHAGGGALSYAPAWMRAAIIAALATKNASPPPPAAQQDAHPDDVAVDRFAAAMKEKMAAARVKGRGGWEDKSQCTAETLSRMLVDHIAKGDPRDVANFCMMLWNREESICAIKAQPTSDAAQQGSVEALRVSPNFGALVNALHDANCKGTLPDAIKRHVDDFWFTPCQAEQDLPAFMRQVGDELVRRDTGAGSFAENMRQALHGRAWLIEQADPLRKR